MFLTGTHFRLAVVHLLGRTLRLFGFKKAFFTLFLHYSVTSSARRHDGVSSPSTDNTHVITTRST